MKGLEYLNKNFIKGKFFEFMEKASYFRKLLVKIEYFTLKKNIFFKKVKKFNTTFSNLFKLKKPIEVLLLK
jgi:uncharacterized protein YutE (UPF0331/DUF86 family)